MALVLHDRVQETSTSTGTGSVTLDGAALGYQSFSVIGNGNTTFYCIAGQGSTEWEVGIGTYTASGTTLSRDLVLDSSNSGSLVNFSAGTKAVFVTYPSEKSVNLDASGNVSALGNVSSGTWQASTVGVAYGGTGVTSSSGANSVVLRDSSGNVVFNNFIAGATSVTAAAGTTVLTVASTRTQILVGSTTQTFQLPDATTLAVGHSFIFVNLSSGLLTVVDDASTTVETIPSGGITQLGALSVATNAGTWGAYSFLPGSYNFNNSTASFGGANITSATWQGSTIGTGYGGTGLTTFVSANNAIYSTSSSGLTAGTLPVAAGGTGVATVEVGHIPFGNGTSPLQSSNALEFTDGILIVGGENPLGGTTNPITAFSGSANNYIQTYIYNSSNSNVASADFVAYADNSTDSHGWADIGFTSSTYASTDYSVTGPNEAYVLGSAPNGSGTTGNLIYATDSTGTDNAHQWYVGGFNQAKSAWKMQLTTSGLQLANALSISNGGTGQTTKAAAFNALSPITTAGDLIIGDGANSATRLGIGSAGQYLTSNGTTATWTSLTGGTSITNTAFTATASQTSFSVSYTVGLIEVFRNGVCLVPGTDYTASNGSTVDLATGATAGDSILVVAFSPINVYASITTDYFSGNGSATSFTMSVTPADASSVLVTISGVVQDPSSYSVAGTTLTFSAAPPSGSNNITARYLGVPSLSTVSSFSAGSTGFTPSTSTSGSVTLAGTLNVANGGTGATTLTGIVKGNGTSAFSAASAGTDYVAPGGALGTPSSGTLTNCTADGTNKVGYRNVPAVGTKTTSYTLAITDVGKYVQISTGGSIVIPDATFSEGDVISLFNNTSGNITITCSITTAYIGGTDSDKATMTLATRGVATVLFISGTVCVVSGNVT